MNVHVCGNMCVCVYTYMCVCLHLQTWCHVVHTCPVSTMGPVYVRATAPVHLASLVSAAVLQSVSVHDHTRYNYMFPGLFVVIWINCSWEGTVLWDFPAPNLLVGDFPCLNGGECVSGHCRCPEGFGGMYCEDSKWGTTAAS